MRHYVGRCVIMSYVLPQCHACCHGVTHAVTMMSSIPSQSLLNVINLKNIVSH